MWKIWVKYFDDEGNLTGVGFYWRSFDDERKANRAAKRRYGNSENFQYAVAQTCPW